MEIRPFRGWRYGSADVSPLISPPYDILSQDDRAALLARSPHNIVAVDLPHFPPKKVGPDEVYQQAAKLLEQWKRRGELAQEKAPAIYVYEQAFGWAGRAYARKALICGVRGTRLGEDVIPHEHTFAGPKADRLKLTQCTRMQLSPIFGFYHEPGGVVRGVLESVCAGKPAAAGVLAGVKERLWAVSDPGLIKTVVDALRPAPVFIADGHHRYTTALNYRDQLLAAGNLAAQPFQAVPPVQPAPAQPGKAVLPSPIDSGHEANFVMFALVERDDPGLLILPTHRIIGGLAPDFSFARLIASAGEFDWIRLPSPTVLAGDSEAVLAGFGKGAMALVRDGQAWVARLRDAAVMDALTPDELPQWRQLDVAILHRLLIDDRLKPWHRRRAGQENAELSIEYTPRIQDVLARCAEDKLTLGVCLQATTLKSVEAIASLGATMPHKSTYFYPKLATGLVLKPLE
jgi:uncharacterized protein (DUF1015 family)